MAAKEKPRPFIAPCWMIWKIRTGKGLNGKQFAKKLGVAPATVTQLELDPDRYTPELINKVCKVLGVLPNLLFTLDEKEEKVLKALQQDPS